MGVTTWSQDVVQPASDLRQRQRHPLTTCPDHRNGSPGSSSGDRCRRHLKFDPLAAAEFDNGVIFRRRRHFAPLGTNAASVVYGSGAANSVRSSRDGTK